MMAVQIQFRRGAGSTWASANTVLAEGEVGINTTTSQFKIGDGTTAWNSLSYAPISGTVANIDDITNVTITSAASGEFLKWNGTAWVNDAIDLGTDTTGNYVATITGGTGVSSTAATTGEGTTHTLSIGQAVATNSNVTFNNLTVAGDLTVSGATTSINTEILTVNDNVVVLNNNVTGSPTENAGIEVERGTSTNVVLRWNETSDKWELTNDGSTYADIATESYAASLTPATLDAIGDVTITSVATDQLLKWSGSAWVNATIALTPTWEDGNNILANASFG
jgi:Major tropism determinant N-terminal domain